MGKNDVQVDATALYLPAGGFLLRTPALPARTFHQLAAAHTEEDAPVLNLETVLQRQRSSTLQTVSALSARPQVELAIAIASFSLHQGLLQWRQGALRPRRINKTAAGLLRYLIRMSTRPTPFGLFSGVGLGFFGQRTTLELGAPAIERMRSRPDMTWLLAVLKELEASPARVQQLAVHTNQLAYLAGGRVLLPHTDTYVRPRWCGRPWSWHTSPLPTRPCARRSCRPFREPPSSKWSGSWGRCMNTACWSVNSTHL